MRNLASAKLMYVKAGLLLVAGILAGLMLIAQNPSISTTVLLGVCVWGCCRAYYFAFYVMQRYVDPAYRFSGLVSLTRYLLARRREPT